MYSRNLFNFLKPAIPKGEFAVDWKDEVFAGAVLTHEGAIKHEATRKAVEGGNMIDGVIALYIFMLAAFTGYEVISRVPVILHTPLMSGSNFVHGIVLVGAMVALAAADTTLLRVIGFIGVFLAAGNAVGGYVVTERMLKMFVTAGKKTEQGTLVHGLPSPPKHLTQLSYLVGGGAVHSRPEAHELAGHRGERRALGRARHAARDAA